MLEATEDKSLTNIVSWMIHGRAFKVHNPIEFVNCIMPQFFSQSKYTSFQRQLNMYGFQRFSSRCSKDKGAYYHNNFIRGSRHLCRGIIRSKIKGTYNNKVRGTSGSASASASASASQSLLFLPSSSSSSFLPHNNPFTNKEPNFYNDAAAANINNDNDATPSPPPPPTTATATATTIANIIDFKKQQLQQQLQLRKIYGEPILETSPSSQSYHKHQQQTSSKEEEVMLQLQLQLYQQQLQHHHKQYLNNIKKKEEQEEKQQLADDDDDDEEEDVLSPANAFLNTKKHTFTSRKKKNRNNKSKSATATATATTSSPSPSVVVSSQIMSISTSNTILPQQKKTPSSCLISLSSLSASSAISSSSEEQQHHDGNNASSSSLSVTSSSFNSSSNISPTMRHNIDNNYCDKTLETINALSTETFEPTFDIWYGWYSNTNKAK
jgi:hypothetical protein